MERKIVFLDIDGVLQPGSSQKRHEYIKNEEDEEKLYQRMERYFDIDFRKYKWYDVAAVFWDWDNLAVELLKLTLNLTGAKIVLSSDWRKGGFERMRDFFLIHELDSYFIDVTGDYEKIDESFIQAKNAEYQGKMGQRTSLDHRTVEILEWLSRNPDVKKWIAIDDWMLNGIDDHFVETDWSYKGVHAEKGIRILLGL